MKKIFESKNYLSNIYILSIFFCLLITLNLLNIFADLKNIDNNLTGKVSEQIKFNNSLKSGFIFYLKILSFLFILFMVITFLILKNRKKNIKKSKKILKNTNKKINEKI